MLQFLIVRALLMFYVGVIFVYAFSVLSRKSSRNLSGYLAVLFFPFLLLTEKGRKKLKKEFMKEK